MKCPICEINLKEENPEYCGQCGWEFKRYLSEVSEKEREAYKRRVEIARGNWRRLQELEQGKARPAERKTPKTDSASPKAGAQSSAPSGESRFSEDTPPPDFERDPFETVEEFEARINNHPPVLAGTGTLVKAGYDIDTGRFPVKVEWKGWVPKVPGLELPKKDADTAIKVKRETARALWENGPGYPVFLAFSIRGGAVKAETCELVARGTGFSIQGLSGGKAPERLAGETWVGSATGMEFVWVPGGTFKMGDLFMEGEENELPVHDVRLSGFWMGKYPVTRGQFKEFVIDGGAPDGKNAGFCNGMGKPQKIKQDDTHPVVCVSWKEATAFAKWLSKKSGVKIQLPTEAQWEYAARSGGKIERYAGGDTLDELAWYSGKSGGGTQPVGTKRPNGLGLCDMSGNVCEWCADWYGPNYYAESPGENPQGPKDGANRVNRGGAWSSLARYCRAANRYGNTPSNRYVDLGFRVLAERRPAQAR